MLHLVLLVLASIVLALFCVANLHVVEMKTVFGESVRASLAFLLLGAFAAGFFCSSMVALQRALRARWRERREREPLEPVLIVPPPPPSPGPLVRPQTAITASLQRRWR